MFKMLTASAVAGFFIFMSAIPPVGSASHSVSDGKRIYLVVLRDSPTAKARKPAAGQRFNKRDPEAVRYANRLHTQHDSLLSTVGNPRKLYSYAYALNGFAAELNSTQLAKLRADPNVLAVVPNEIRKPDTLTTPAFLGLSEPNGIWDQLGGGERAGQDVVVGVIDTGIWPENPSFAPRPVHAGPLPGWTGECTPGEQFPVSSCNNKIVGARWFNDGYGGDAAIKARFPYEFISPRAADGHGVHTAGTAVGNYRVHAETGGVDLGRLSGMAPGARLAVYKACWGYEDDVEHKAGCTVVDSVAAIDQAVSDGVDVINFSISGSTTNLLDPVELAFLNAAEAGLFVATSAGNDGTHGASTVAHNSPWVTTVAAGTHDRRYSAAVIFTSGARFRGTSVDDRGVGNHPVVLAATAGLAGQNPAEVAVCLPGTLDPAIVAGKIVVCDRGVNARVEKSQVVADSGGVGMILVNPKPDSLNTDIHAVPTVHVDDVVGAALKNYLNTSPNSKARLTAGVITTGPQNPAPDVIKESSRGPALASGGDILKPDLLAPGRNILAAISPARTGLDFDFASGTSMSSAFIAGIAALLKQQHPNWSPAAIKSALMTTATVKRNDGSPILEEVDGTTKANALAFGSGLVQPSAAMDPGLIYDANVIDWLAFLCGAGQVCVPPIAAVNPSDLNYPSISIGGLAGEQKIHRTVTNVGRHRSHYEVKVQTPPGIDIDVSPREFTIAPGQSRSYWVKVRRDGAALDKFALGSLTWTDGEHRVRSPIAVRPVALSAPTEVFSHGGKINYSVTFGYTGSFKASARGLVPALINQAVVEDDPSNDINTALSPGGTGTVTIPVLVSTGSTYARFSLFDANTDGNDNLDLYVFRSNGEFVAGSAGATSNEEVNLVNPAPDIYLVVVHGRETDGPDAHFTLFSWTLGTASAGNVSISAPAKAQLARDATIGLSFSKLQPGVKYLGAIAYEGPGIMPSPTIVRVDR